MRSTRLTILFAISILTAAGGCQAQKTGEQLFPGHMIAAADLAKQIADAGKAGAAPAPLILNIGPRKNLPGAIKLSPASEDEGLANLKAKLATLPKDAPIVIYCGCCPYEHCPNVHPAAELLETMKFTNYKFLDLPHNIDVDWVKKGYPMGS